MLKNQRDVYAFFKESDTWGALVNKYSLKIKNSEEMNKRTKLALEQAKDQPGLMAQTAILTPSKASSRGGTLT
jgi:hypothetical protein